MTFLRASAIRRAGVLAALRATAFALFCGGLYPPVEDAALAREASVYAGEKGNLRFPYDRPIPHDLIRRIVEHRVRESARRKRR